MLTRDMPLEAGNELSGLEKEYLCRVVNGWSLASIMHELNLSSAAAADVRKSLERKLGVATTAGLVREGLLAGL